uniref:Uncharacterized protein n=1 Tax=Podoviridae sp. ctaUh10 TaxID=2826563 RepID=A0A8S5QSE3_9CAUD|nr:MAG TPA: hypothetical protein [Podoviridae sp. ctaUh10]
MLSKLDQLISIALSRVKSTKLNPIFSKIIISRNLPVKATNSTADTRNPLSVKVMIQIVITTYQSIKIPSIITGLLPHTKTGNIVSKNQRSPTLITSNSNQLSR